MNQPAAPNPSQPAPVPVANAGSGAPKPQIADIEALIETAIRKVVAGKSSDGFPIRFEQHVTISKQAANPKPTGSMKISPSITAAIQNIATFGDTDIFPFLFERHIFQDRPELLQKALETLHAADLEAELARNPPDNINTLAPVGHTGFRWATQIDPLWNAYYLALVIEMGPAIEQARIPASENTVFSYRFTKPSADGRIFDENVNWRGFMETCYATAEQAENEAEKEKSDRNAKSETTEDDPTERPYVILCDISDFYARIYHHRVENALKWLGTMPDIVKRIVSILQVFSGTASYGLPVGGPASRLLAELALNSVDKLLRGEGIRFARFVDDYRIFCRSKEEAYQRLIFLSEKLFNEGLSLQKNKTRILTSKEFLSEIRLLLKSHQKSEENLTDEDRLLRLTINFDPYSETRVDDYEKLKLEISKVDIAGILSRELEKTRIDPALTKQAISALRVVEPAARKEILKSLLQRENLDTLSPVFPRLMTVLRVMYSELDAETRDVVDRALIDLVTRDSHIIKLDLNLAYAVRVLRKRHTHETEALLVKVFKSNTSPLVRREIVLAWAEWKHTHSLSDLKKHFHALSKWERRAFVVASYILTDEGKHWRQHNDESFSPGELVVRDWYSKRFNENPDAPL